MIIISKAMVSRFGEKHADSITPLNDWYKAVKNADWANSAEIKRDFNSVDSIGNDRFVFNIKGNKYRLVAMIFFDKRTVFIRFIGTHSEYDRIDCATI